MSSSPAAEPVGNRSGFAHIAHTLRGAITRGELPPGTQFSPIAELARKYGTTPITVRRALRELEEEGLIRVEHGVGTFVADWARQYDLLHLPGFSTEMADRNLPVVTEVCGRDFDVRRPQAAAALGLSADVALPVLARLRLAAGRPIVVQRSYLLPQMGELVREYSPDQSLYEVLSRRFGRAPFSADEVIQAVRMDGEEAGHLQQEAGAAGWRTLRTTFDAAGLPLVFDEACFPADCVELRARRQPGQTRIRFEITVPDKEERSE